MVRLPVFSSKAQQDWTTTLTNTIPFPEEKTLSKQQPSTPSTDLRYANGITLGQWRSLQLTELIGSSNAFTPAYHPSSNGAVEQFMKALRRLIITYTENSSITANWDQHLRIIQFVYNTTVNDTTQHTPFFLAHGRHPRTPLVIVKESHLVDYYHSPLQQYALDLQDRLNTAFDLMDRLKTTKTQTQQLNQFATNDLVLIYNQSHTTKNKPRKLAFDWSGPLLVIAIPSKSTCDLKHQATNKIVKNVHVSRLKKYYPTTDSS